MWLLSQRISLNYISGTVKHAYGFIYLGSPFFFIWSWILFGLCCAHIRKEVEHDHYLRAFFGVSLSGYSAGPISIYDSVARSDMKDNQMMFFWSGLASLTSWELIHGWILLFSFHKCVFLCCSDCILKTVCWWKYQSIVWLYMHLSRDISVLLRRAGHTVVAWCLFSEETLRMLSMSGSCDPCLDGWYSYLGSGEETMISGTSCPYCQVLNLS